MDLCCILGRTLVLVSVLVCNPNTRASTVVVVGTFIIIKFRTFSSITYSFIVFFGVFYHKHLVSKYHALG